MGYDMRFHSGKPAGEAERVKAATDAFHAACKVRDALPKSEAGHYRQGIDSDAAKWGDEPNSNATLRYAAAQSEVSRLYTEMYEAERSYFRLNIFGMGRVRDAMYALGMIYESPSSNLRQFPDYPDSEVVQNLIEEIDYPEYATEHKPGEVVHQDDLFEARAYIKQRNALLAEHPGNASGIPAHKFGSNDGWIVTPAECEQALKAWHSATGELRREAFNSAGLTGEDWSRIWARWIDYLTLSQQYGGFEVH